MQCVAGHNIFVQMNNVEGFLPFSQNFAALDMENVRLSGAHIYGFSLTKLKSVDRRMKEGEFPPVSIAHCNWTIYDEPLKTLS